MWFGVLGAQQTDLLPAAGSDVTGGRSIGRTSGSPPPPAARVQHLVTQKLHFEERVCGQTEQTATLLRRCFAEPGSEYRMGLTSPSPPMELLRL